MDVQQGTTSTQVHAPMRTLLGDANANGAVNASDVGMIKAQAGLAVTSANFRADVTANGSINASDVALVKSRSGQ